MENKQEWTHPPAHSEVEGKSVVVKFGTSKRKVTFASDLSTKAELLMLRAGFAVAFDDMLNINVEEWKLGDAADPTELLKQDNVSKALKQNPLYIYDDDVEELVEVTESTLIPNKARLIVMPASVDHHHTHHKIDIDKTKKKELKDKFDEDLNIALQIRDLKFHLHFGNFDGIKIPWEWMTKADRVDDYLGTGLYTIWSLVSTYGLGYLRCGEEGANDEGAPVYASGNPDEADTVVHLVFSRRSVSHTIQFRKGEKVLKLGIFDNGTVRAVDPAKYPGKNFNFTILKVPNMKGFEDYCTIDQDGNYLQTIKDGVIRAPPKGNGFRREFIDPSFLFLVIGLRN